MAVDVGYLSAHLGVAQDAVSALLGAPTVDLVTAFIDAVTAKAHEYDDLYAVKLQGDIELENVVRSSEARCQAFKATADKALKDVEDLRRKLQDEGSCLEVQTPLYYRIAIDPIWVISD